MVALAQRQSVQELPEANKSSDMLDFFMLRLRGPILDVYGTLARKQQALNIYRHNYNWALQGAFANIGKLVATTAYELTGPEDASESASFGVDYWQELLINADFGNGWSSFIQKGVLDYLRYDTGWFIEVIGPGSPMRELTGPVSGLAHLDGMRCTPTGDPEFPVIYVDRKNKMHQLHRSRVIQVLDAPDGDERKPGHGLCALSRAVSIAQREVQMGQYIESYLDDKPPPGVVMTSLTEQKVKQAFAQFRDQQGNDAMPEWGRQLFLYGMGPDLQTTWETAPFQQPPEKFDFEQYTARVDMPALALAIGIDVQDLWQLTGGNLGSGQQSEVLHRKGQGKTIGTLYTSLERALNFNVLPEDFEMSFSTRDVQEEQEQATAASTWINAITSAASNLTEEETRELIAGVDDRFHDAMTEDNGELRVRDDIDRKPEGEQDDITLRDDESIEADDPASERPRPEERTRQLALELDGQRHRRLDTDTASKDIQATRLDFENDWADLVTAAKTGDMARGRFRIVARALLRRHGLQAYKDGLAEGGVETNTLDPDDTVRFGTWLAGRSTYVSGLADRLYKDGVDVNPEATADMWANNSLNEAYYDGLSSAAANGMFEFAGEDGAESCATCKRLKGQRHRMKDWTRRQLRPGVDVANFECGGWHCNHTLIRTSDRARGRF